MRIYIYDSPEEVSQRVSELIIDQVKDKPQSILGLATGSTPGGVYKKLIRAYQEKRVSFRQAKAFNLDEYVGLPVGHSQSYAYYMKKQLFEAIDLPAQHAYIPNGCAEDLEAECLKYERYYAEHGPVDLQLLGIGLNGHIGFNEPANYMNYATHVVSLDESTIKANARFFESREAVPIRAISMGIGTILQARNIVLMVLGADKARILYEAMTGPVTAKCPASFLQTHASVTLVADQLAAGFMDANPRTLSFC